MGVLPLFIVGFVFAVAAFITLKFPPKKINSIYGYRTSRSMKNQENWDLAQRFSSQLMLKQGLILLATAFLLEVLPIPMEVATLISMLLLVTSVIILFVQTEKRLK
jgi:uncharacterized membrane protein